MLAPSALAKHRTVTWKYLRDLKTSVWNSLSRSLKLSKNFRTHLTIRQAHHTIENFWIVKTKHLNIRWEKLTRLVINNQENFSLRQNSDNLAVERTKQKQSSSFEDVNIILSTHNWSLWFNPILDFFYKGACDLVLGQFDDLTL